MSSGTIEQLISDVLEEGGFDVSSERVLKWLSRRQRLMCARSRSYRKRVEIGPTRAGQQNYLVPDEVEEVREVQVDGVVWGAGRHSDIANGNQGWLWLDMVSGSGIAVRDDSVSGETSLALYPVPTDQGQLVSLFAVCVPPDLVAGEDSTLVVPATMHEALVEGACATGFKRLEARPDLAVQFEASFTAACEELARENARRFRGAGAAQIRVVGVNA